MRTVFSLGLALGLARVGGLHSVFRGNKLIEFENEDMSWVAI